MLATQSFRGTAALCDAAAVGNVDLVIKLLAGGAPVNGTVGRVHHSDWTPLFFAAAHGGSRAFLHRDFRQHRPGSHNEVVRVLLQHGATVRFRNNEWRDNPLHLAARRGDADILRQLLAAGADVNQKARGETPLHVASFASSRGTPNSLDCVKLLIMNGAEPDTMDNNSRRPAYYARKGSEVEEWLKAKPVRFNQMLQAERYGPMTPPEDTSGDAALARALQMEADEAAAAAAAVPPVAFTAPTSAHAMPRELWLGALRLAEVGEKRSREQ